MDPTLTLIEFLTACKDKNHIVAEEYLEHLRNWIHKGGHLPKVLRVEIDYDLVDVAIQKEVTE